VNKFFVDTRLANTVDFYYPEPPDIKMKVPDKVKKCVVYLGVEASSDYGNETIYCGTGFFISTPSKISGKSFIYLVTAKHVCVELNKRKDFILRANSTQGKSIEVKIKSGEITWYFHPTDSAADVAITTINISPDLVDFSTLPASMFMTPDVLETRGIGAGDDVFVTGLFVYHKGNAKNIPIIRTGNIAMIPDERIATHDFGDMEAYLIEVWSIGGLSGSPVFALKPVESQKSMFYLIGFIQGHWNTKAATIIDTTIQDGKINADVNVGIAIVTPAQKILDIVYSEKLNSLRKLTEDSYIGSNSPTPD
jgi:hypothetical protein